ncbi:hypothetical protein PV326_001358, partial [Microctonus aethiopoides]
MLHPVAEICRNVVRRDDPAASGRRMPSGTEMEPEFAPNDPKQKEQKAARQGKEFEGTFMTEAKDWAGELISGQTTTGRIL